MSDIETEYAQQYKERIANRVHGFAEGDRVVVKDLKHSRFKQVGRIVQSQYGCSDWCASHCQRAFVDFGEGCKLRSYDGIYYDDRLDHSQLEHVD